MATVRPQREPPVLRLPERAQPSSGRWSSSSSAFRHARPARVSSRCPLLCYRRGGGELQKEIFKRRALSYKLRYCNSGFHKYGVDLGWFAVTLRGDLDVAAFTSHATIDPGFDDSTEQGIGPFRLINFHHDHLLAPFLQLFSCSFKHEPALGDDRQVSCDLLDFGKQMAGEKYRHSASLG